MVSADVFLAGAGCISFCVPVIFDEIPGDLGSSVMVGVVVAFCWGRIFCRTEVVAVVASVVGVFTVVCVATGGAVDILVVVAGSMGVVDASEVKVEAGSFFLPKEKSGSDESSPIDCLDISGSDWSFLLFEKVKNTPIRMGIAMITMTIMGIIEENLNPFSSDPSKVTTVSRGGFVSFCLISKTVRG